MNYFKDIIEASKDSNKKNDVIEAVNYLVNKNIDEIFPTIKTIFFHPLTAKEIRISLGNIIASTKSKAIYNMLLSHLILRNFSDLPAIIYTIGEYKDEKIYDLLVREYTTCNFDSKIQIVIAIGKIKSTKSIEFFSKVYNDESMTKNLTPEQIQKIKEKAGEALQNQVIDI
ncbi:MAG: hypothetical protein AABZ74_08555 [Cyanobacteriota bacterium]